MSTKAVIVSTARTPFGRLNGALAGLSATSLGAIAIRGALERGSVDPAVVEHVIMGQVIQAGVGQAPVRQALLKAGLATTVTGETINKVCASGLLAVVMAARLIRDGGARAVIAGGMESMSNAPHLLPGARSGFKYGDAVLQDSVLKDGLLDTYLNITMASAAAKVADQLGPARDIQDAFAYQSHRRASTAIEQDLFHAEILPLLIPERVRERILVDEMPTVTPALAPYGIAPTPDLHVDYQHIMPFMVGDVAHRVFEHDEAVRHDVSLAAMSDLKPLDRGGSITAGNAPGLNDGAAALVIMNEDWARELELEPLAEVVAHATVAWESPYLAITPALAIEKLLAQQSLSTTHIDVWEINEAFAAVALQSINRLGLSPEAVNRQGGAIALGHPLGASGARIVGSVVAQLRRNGGRLGVAAICSGGGQGDAVLIRAYHPA